MDRSVGRERSEEKEKRKGRRGGGRSRRKRRTKRRRRKWRMVYRQYFVILGIHVVAKQNVYSPHRVVSAIDGGCWCSHQAAK